jgi:hypothetical protein
MREGCDVRSILRKRGWRRLFRRKQSELAGVVGDLESASLGVCEARDWLAGLGRQEGQQAEGDHGNPDGERQSFRVQDLCARYGIIQALCSSYGKIPKEKVYIRDHCERQNKIRSEKHNSGRR